MIILKEIFLSPDFWKFVIPLMVTVIAWLVNEWRKRVADQYQRKEESYKKLIHSLRGFYEEPDNDQGSNNNSLVSDFLEEINITWLYCPDDVILKGYAFLETVQTKHSHEDKDKEKDMGEIILAIRQNQLSSKLHTSTSTPTVSIHHHHAQYTSYSIDASQT